MSNWWDADPAGGQPLRITVFKGGVSPESFQANNRGFSVGDVRAAVDGDMLNAPGLPIKYEAQHGQTFGVDATKNAQPFSGIVAHHTGGPTLDGALNSARRGTPLNPDVKYGYHFYIDTDGTVVQGAPLDARTNHVQPPGAAQRTSRPEISNNNSIGISFVGKGSNPTPEQQAAAVNLTRALQSRFGITPDNVVGHGEIQNNRQASEGMPLVNAIRGSQAVAEAPTLGMGTQPAQAAARTPDSGKNWWDADQPVKDVGRGTALLEGVLSGASANFSDEVYGASKASGLPEILGGFRAPVGAARLAYEHLTGQPGEATKAYEAAVADKRGVQKAAQDQYPGSYIAGQVGGSILLPGGAAMQAATMPARIARSAAVGAAYGGASGVGEGTTVEDRLSRGAMGTILGATVGAVAPPLVEGAIQGVRAAVNPMVTAVRGAANPEAEAGRRVAMALHRDAQADPAAVASLTPQEFAQNVASGGPARIMDMGGETTRGLARSAANTSPEGRGVLGRAIDDRFERQAERLVNWLNQTFHYPNAMAQQLAIDNIERTVNRAGYGRAYRAGDSGVWSPELERLTGSPAVVDAMRAASERGRDRAIAQGFGAFNPGVQVTQDGRVAFTRARGGVPAYPNLQFWDYAFRELRDAATAAARSGRNEEAGSLGMLARQLRNELDAQVPQFAQARAGAAAFFRAENALEAGQNFVAQRFDLGQTRAALARMTPAERQLFQDGFVSRFIETLNARPDRRNVLNQLAESPAAREQMSIAIGPQRAAELEGMLRVEGIMDLVRGATQGNSTTARQLAELGFASGAGGLGAYGAYNLDPTQMAYAAVAGALLAGKRGIDSRLAQVVARQLTSSNPNDLALGIRLLARNNRMMDNLRSVDRRIAASGSEQTPTGLAVQSLSAGRADQDEPKIPGPSNQ